MWRLLHTFGIGIVLRWQSQDKFWTKHFIRHGYNAQEAFANWKSLYNLTMTMTHVSFFFCALVLYDRPSAWLAWLSGTSLLKHTLGLVRLCERERRGCTRGCALREESDEGARGRCPARRERRGCTRAVPCEKRGTRVHVGGTELSLGIRGTVHVPCTAFDRAACVDVGGGLRSHQG